MKSALKFYVCLILTQVLIGCGSTRQQVTQLSSMGQKANVFARDAVSTAPTKVIFDSDASSDWDDVGDIAVLNSLADLGQIEILGTMSSSQNGATALFMNSINTYYGRPNVPCGRRADIGGVGGYPATIASQYPHPLYAKPTDVPLAANLYRQLLAAQPNNSVVIVTTGFLNNLQALLQSGPDQYSPLTGQQLVAQKVKYWSNAGGDYPSGGEFNLTVEPAAAYYVVNNWPAGVVDIGFTLGGAIYSGWNLPSTPANNPVREVYVDIENGYPHPTWGQIAVYYAAREAECQNLFNFVSVGHNNANPDGTNFWTASPDPSGLQDQKYLTEIQRQPIEEAINTLVQQSGYPAIGPASAPGQPTNIRATIANENEIDLQWTDNSYNETGFVIERKINGVFTQVGAVGSNVTSFADTGLSNPAVAAYRVKAVNAQGSSNYTTKTVYRDGWTDVNLSNPGDTAPIYYNYEFDDLTYFRPGPVSHVTINNDSNHGTNLTINLKVGSKGSYGPFYVYFFYQDQNNWYRLNAGMAGENESIKFEKSIGGVITQIGGTATGEGFGPGTAMQTWQITVTPAGQLQFFSNQNPNNVVLPLPTMNLMLSASDTLSFSSGKIALGSLNGTPVWQAFAFDTTLSPGSVATPTPVPTPVPTPLPTATPVTTATPVPTATPSSPDASAVAIQVVVDDLCLEVKNGGIDQTTCSASAATQQFALTSSSSSKFEVSQSGLCLTDASGSLQETSCNGAVNQTWTTAPSLDGSSMIVSIASGLCLNIAYNSNSAGAPLILYSCSGYAANERFQFGSVAQSPAPTPTPIPTPVPTQAPTATPIPTPTPGSGGSSSLSSSIVSSLSGLCLEQKSGSIDQTTCSPSASNQAFTRSASASGSFMIMQSNLCLDDNNNALQAVACSGALNQSWHAQASLDGSTMIVNSSSGNCFNVAYQSAAVGIPIILYQCNAYATNERFQFR